LNLTTPKPVTGVRTVVLEDESSLAPHLPAWEDLAIACGRPFCLPGWMLAWWREASEAQGGELRVILVLEGEDLVGIGPFFANPTGLGLIEMRLLGAGFSHRIGPLAKPGDEDRVAAALATTLAALEPHPASVVFEGVDVADGWPALIARHWPGRPPRLRRDATMDAPLIALEGDYERWLGQRSKNFRKGTRRRANRLEEAGVRPRTANDPAAIEALLALHHVRWRELGGSDVDAAAERILRAATENLSAQDLLEVVLLEGPDGPISAELMVHAGRAATLWSGGFDPAWSSLAPGTNSILAALREAAGRGVETVDLGGGGDEYKRKLADTNNSIAWQTLFPRGLRYPLIRLRLAPKHARHALRRLAQRLPDPLRQTAKRLTRRTFLHSLAPLALVPPPV
jgi:CelD/BcsL family acetyltransferase involved in cellulose biosynthesis